MSLALRQLSIPASFLSFGLAATAMFAPDPRPSNGNTARPIQPSWLAGARRPCIRESG